MVNRKGIKKSNSGIKRGVVENPVDKFLVPDRGDIVDSDIYCRTGSPGYI